jgi:predicted nucleic acid-binding protein
MTRIYLDACCLNRPFDDQSQPRVRLEAEAVVLVLARFRSGVWEWVGSEVLTYEIEQTPDLERRTRVKLIASYIQHSVSLDAAIVTRALYLESLGFHPFDALHLACAEGAATDVFLTTDDRLIRRAHRLAQQLNVVVMDPLAWIRKG